ncbi:MAG: hypothetical protein JWN86_339 [Planctomycetota bacterium]|nr:hypothetical protein [Planctomycetota bacterium]
MKTITLELSEEQHARLTLAAESGHETIRELLNARLIDLLEESVDPFDPRANRQRDRHEEFMRRLA